METSFNTSPKGLQFVTLIPQQCFGYHLLVDSSFVVGGFSGPQLAQQPRKSKSARESEKPSGMAGGDGGA